MHKRIAFILAFVALARPVAAQTADNVNTLAGILPDLLLREVRLVAPQGAVFAHDAHFTPFATGDRDNPAIGIVESFTKLMAVQLSTFPLGSSSGGFTYSFDPTLGTFNRASRSFGPAFAERALTIGKGRFSAGMNYQYTTYDSFEGLNLEDGAIKIYLRHKECCSTGGPAGPPFFGTIEQPDNSRLTPSFEGDLVESTIVLKVHTQTAAFFLNYGVSNRLDVGIAVPVVQVDLDASVLATIKRLATGAASTIHTFEVGNAAATTKTYARSGTATGIGDVVLRSKYRLVEGPGAALAAAVDFRLPTGDKENLLGAGTQGKAYLIVSAERGRFGQHANVGYSFAGDSLPVGSALTTLGRTPGQVPDEINYTGGVEFAASSRITLVGDIVGRTLRDAGRLDPASKTFQFQMNPAVTPTPSVQFEEFEPRAGSLTLLLGTAGVKFNPGGNLLISANALFPLTNAGLHSRASLVLGLDYAF